MLVVSCDLIHTVWVRLVFGIHFTSEQCLVEGFGWVGVWRGGQVGTVYMRSCEELLKKPTVVSADRASG